MSMKRFLVPVMALAAFGLPLGATVVPYCNNFCGGNDTATFASIVALDGYTYASGTDLTFTGSLSDGGLQYVDAATSVLFSASSIFTITVSDVLEAGANKAITISVPAGYGAVQLFVSQTGVIGNAYTYTDPSQDATYLTSTPVEVDYINTAGLGAAWSITITPGLSSEQVIIDSFNPAGTSQGTGGSDTPEVGTLLLIGSGLIGMRWMKGLPRRFLGTPQTA
jgi:hypothetical protein